jgi:flagellar hook protein FlgE
VIPVWRCGTLTDPAGRGESSFVDKVGNTHLSGLCAVNDSADDEQRAATARKAFAALEGRPGLMVVCYGTLTDPAGRGESSFVDKVGNTHLSGLCAVNDSADDEQRAATARKAFAALEGRPGLMVV